VPPAALGAVGTRRLATGVSNLDEVVAAPAGLPPPLRVARRLDQHAGGGGGDAEGGPHRVGAHGGDDGGAQGRAGVLGPAPISGAF
jgi:hypothetical protein